MGSGNVGAGADVACGGAGDDLGTLWRQPFWRWCDGPHRSSDVNVSGPVMAVLMVGMVLVSHGHVLLGGW